MYKVVGSFRQEEMENILLRVVIVKLTPMGQMDACDGGGPSGGGCQAGHSTINRV